MKITKHLLALALGALTWMAAAAEGTSPASVGELLDRVCGPDAKKKITYILDPDVAENGQETFVITSEGNKPVVKGSTLSALTTGIGWYLNHEMKVNLSWNHITDHSLVNNTWPAPKETYSHSSRAVYRYYLNYCTMSYSMSTWTWDRWQQEIDWMALRGINMPLVITGMEEVWRRLLRQYDYTDDEIAKFVAGPAYVAWWGMSNLEGSGSIGKDWWYNRQFTVGQNIVNRMRELGIDPVLPGFYYLPSTFTTKTGIKTHKCGKWCEHQRPYYVNATDPRYEEVASKYYACMKEVFGDAKYYSMDPYHEGTGNTNDPTPPEEIYPAIFGSMQKNVPGSKMVVQQWQWKAGQAQYQMVNLLKDHVGSLIFLDLYADAKPAWATFGDHHVIFSTIFNFGGRTGFFGRFNGVIDGYFAAVAGKATVKGIGAAPEAIEQTPVMYDLLFELPWYSTAPDAKQWMAEYAERRYGKKSAEAAECWELLRNSALDCKTSLQGPHEAVMCGRPALTMKSVSTWGGTEIFYDTSVTAQAVYNLLNAKLSGQNYSYDLTDLTRQALTDYSKSLLAELNAANTAKDTERFNRARDNFLQLMDDVDELLNTNALFMLGHWTELSRGMAGDVPGTSEADADLLEAYNARQLITTWGQQAQAEGGGLHDYSYRQWGGMVKDFYRERWRKWFENGMSAPSEGWFAWEWTWAHTLDKRYPTEPVGDTHEVAARILPKYLSPFVPAIENAQPYYVPRMLTTDRKGRTFDLAKREEAYTPNFQCSGAKIVEIAIDFSKNTRYDDDEIVAGSTFNIPADAPIGERTARITLDDGTVFTYTLQIIEEITEPRTVSVATSDAKKGTVSIEGTDVLSVSTMEPVVLHATADIKYDFDHWQNAAGENVGNDNPMRYMSRAGDSFTAYFAPNKWGVPEVDPKDNGANGAIANNKQWVTEMSVTQNGENTVLYSQPTKPDEQYIYIPNRIKAAPGGEFTFHYTGDKAGFAYLFLTAYMDKNIDGKFDMTTDELLGSIGTSGAQNQAVGNGTFTVLMPYDCARGTTHIRLRFDSAWNSLYNATYHAMPAEASTNRFIYELLLDIQDAPEYACNISVHANNNAMGSVRSENESGIYDPGEQVIMTAFPNPGFRIVGWKDNHDRWMPEEWQSEDHGTIRFGAFDNCQVTAIFEKLPMMYGDWEMSWDVDDHGNAFVDGIIKEGSSILDLTQNSIDVPIDYVKQNTLLGNTTIEEVILPNKHIEEWGEYSHATIVGDSIQNSVHELTHPVSNSKPWTMVAEGHYGGTTYNQYGSCLLSNYSSTLLNAYSGGWFQWWLSASKQIEVKMTEKKSFTNVTIEGDFKIKAVYDGSNSCEITVESNGKSQTQTFASSCQAMTNLYTSLAHGSNLNVSFYGEIDDVCPGHFETSVKGNSAEQTRIDLPFELPVDKHWTVSLQGSTTDASKGFSDYGSGLLATGDDALANYYTGGFQIFLNSKNNAGVVYIKTGRGEYQGFSKVITPNFNISIEHFADNSTRFVTNNGNAGTFSLASDHLTQAIDHFVCKIPDCLTISKLEINIDETVVPMPQGELFRGCYSLQNFRVADGEIYHEEDGVIYNKANKVVAYPEGRLMGAPVMLQTATGEHIVASPVKQADGSYTDTDVKVADASATPLQALWQLTDSKLIHANSGIEAHSDIQSWAMVYGLTEPAITFTAGEQHLSHADGKLVTADEAHPFRFTIANELTVGEETSTEPMAISFPVPVMVTEDAEVYGVKEITADGKATIFRIPPYATVDPDHAVISLQGMISLPAVQIATMAETPDNLLLGTNAARFSTEDYWLLEGTTFTKHPATSIIPANAAYVTVPANVELQDLELDTTGIEELSTINYQPATIYDLLGRRLIKPAKGINIINGTKVRK